jgi:hypothetical protein
LRRRLFVAVHLTTAACKRKFDLELTNSGICSETGITDGLILLVENHYFSLKTDTSITELCFSSLKIKLA